LHIGGNDPCVQQLACRATSASAAPAVVTTVGGRAGAAGVDAVVLRSRTEADTGSDRLRRAVLSRTSSEEHQLDAAYGRVHLV